MNKRFYVTTAIFYTNGEAHVGHAYEMVVTDVIARARRSLGHEVFFLTGLDEHGQKVQQAATAEGLEPQAYCDRLAARWSAFADRLGISHDDFIRTTQPRHQEVVQAILHKLHAEDLVYKGGYTGWYSVREETFLTDKDRLPDGSWDPKWGQVVELQEENWYFRMGRFQPWLLAHLEAHPEFVQPASRRNEVLGFLRSEKLEDLCISRPASRLAWGIPIPFDPEYVNYVWFDALTNYFSVPASAGDPAAAACLGGHYTRSRVEPATPPTAAGCWPADVHVIGKDIVKFHAVYWPIMLHALGAPLPRQVLVHGWWQKDGQKLSKSTGNILDPLAVIDAWGLDAFRYYVVRELDIGPDGNWTDTGFSARYHAELANGLGNLLNRTLNMLNKYRGGRLAVASGDLAADARSVADRVRVHWQANELQAGLQATWDLVNRANLYVEQTQPFRLAKDPAQAGRLDEVLYSLAESCRVLAVLLWPYIPGTASRMFAQLGLTTSPDRWSDAAWGGLPAGHQVGSPEALFPRRDQPTAG